MSALVAFTGPPDPALLNRMVSRLSHRGQLLESPISTSEATLAVCEWGDHSPPGRLRTGYFRVEDQSTKVETRVAFSGFAFSQLPSSLTDLTNELRGSYSIAMLDSAGTLIIARDAVGSQSLYYGRMHDPKIGTRWLVATEPKAITLEKSFQAKIRAESVAQYLAFSFVPAEHTMLEDVFEAEAGWQIELRGELEPKRRRKFFFRRG